MGTLLSRRRRGMNDETGEIEDTNRSRSNTDDSDGADLAAVLSYLIRSGQVRVISSNGIGDNRWEDDDDEEEFMPDPVEPPAADPNPDTRLMDNSELREEILRCSQVPNYKKLSIAQLLQRREVGSLHQKCFTPAQQCNIATNFLPNSMDVKVQYHHKAFCGTYSTDGNIFLSACQDRCLRIYDTHNDNFKQLKCITARDVGWSVLDTAFSPDGNYLVYSSWSDCLHLCNIHGDHDVHDVLPLCPQGHHSFCIFSLMFSSDNSEIMGGANDGHLYIYDRERNERTLKVDGHEDDVNAVCFADASSQILFSGGDDGLVKVWDRRTLSEESPSPVGVLAGHFDGITFIDTKGDGRYLLSNCKDQTIKLWDMRQFSSNSAVDATREEVSKQTWDYRWQQVPKKVLKKRFRLDGDSSIMTYRGHRVLHTLVRARFSPQATTGGQYIYTGCASGAVVVYDILTGKVVTDLPGQRACVRDVSWHPYENKIMSTSWDGTIALWTYQYNDMDDDNKEDEEEEEEGGPRKRRSRRRPCRRRSLRNPRSGMAPWP